MSYRVYEFRDQDRPRLDAELSVDPLWKLGYSERHARHFGLDRDTFFVVLEGAEAALKEADAFLLRFGRKPPQDEALLMRFRAEDVLAAQSLGELLGPVKPEWREVPPKPPTRRQVLRGMLAARLAALRERWERVPKPWARGAPWWKVWAWRRPAKEPARAPARPRRHS